MKAVQIGILAALLLCAGLLFKIYRGQQRPAPAAAAPAASVPTAAVSTPAPPPVAAPPVPEAATPRPALPQPKPWREAKKKTPVQRAESSPPADPAPAPAEQQPAAAPPAPVETAPPPPAPVPAPVLNPPSGTEAAPPPRMPNTVTIPAGSLITVRLGETLSSDKNQSGDTFSAALDQPLVVDGFAIAERGARVQGKVLESEKAGRVKGVATLALHLTRLRTADGQEIDIETERFATEGPESKSGDAKKVAVGAALGAAIGAGAGSAAGGGVVLATRGKPAELPVEVRLTFRIQRPVTITERIP